MALSHIKSCNLLRKWYSSSSPKAFIIITAKVEEHDLKEREMKYLLVTSSMQQELAPKALSHASHYQANCPDRIQEFSGISGAQLAYHSDHQHSPKFEAQH